MNFQSFSPQDFIKNLEVVAQNLDGTFLLDKEKSTSNFLVLSNIPCGCSASWLSVPVENVENISLIGYEKCCEKYIPKVGIKFKDEIKKTILSSLKDIKSEQSTLEILDITREFYISRECSDKTYSTTEELVIPDGYGYYSHYIEELSRNPQNDPETTSYKATLENRKLIIKYECKTHPDCFCVGFGCWGPHSWLSIRVHLLCSKI